MTVLAFYKKIKLKTEIRRLKTSEQINALKKKYRDKIDILFTVISNSRDLSLVLSYLGSKKFS